MLWRAGRHEFRFPRPTLVMGVLNVTPDSFSDGGRFYSVEAALERAGQMIREGADLLDVGGESTRPGAAPVPTEEEIQRVVPVIQQLAARVSTPISIDTQKPEVARAALLAGASIVNDIAANRADDAMGRVVAEFRAGYVAMHMQGTPQTMQAEPTYADVVAEVANFLGERVAACEAAGITRDRIVVDPGFGFGKTTAHNIALLRGLGKITAATGLPLLAGLSRKSVLGRITTRQKATDRVAASVASALIAVQNGARILRVHDVDATLDMAHVWHALEVA